MISPMSPFSFIKLYPGNQIIHFIFSVVQWYSEHASEGKAETFQLDIKKSLLQFFIKVLSLVKWHKNTHNTVLTSCSVQFIYFIIIILILYIACMSHEIKTTLSISLLPMEYNTLEEKREKEMSLYFFFSDSFLGIGDQIIRTPKKMYTIFFFFFALFRPSA